MNSTKTINQREREKKNIIGYGCDLKKKNLYQELSNKKRILRITDLSLTYPITAGQQNSSSDLLKD